MRKRICVLLLCLLLLFPLAPSVLAAEGQGGFYGVGSAGGVAVTALDADGAEVSAVSREFGAFYPGSGMLRVTLRDTVPGKQYLVTVSEGAKVCCADQQRGGGELSFLLKWKLPEKPVQLTLSIGSNAAGFQTVRIPLAYTPACYLTCEKNDACPLSKFVDLQRNLWYHDGVHWALEGGVMTGTGNARFAPHTATSRAMLVTVLHRLEGSPASAYAMGFRDVQAGKWYAEPIRWAAEHGIVSGYSATSFGPNDKLTREQLAAILLRYAKYKGIDTAEGESAALTGFADVGMISDYAMPALQWAVAVGIIRGTGGGKLSPANSATRAETATMLLRFGQ